MKIILTTLLLAFVFTCKAAESESKVTYSAKSIRIANKTISVEMADSEDRRAHGLMFRSHLAADHGMLFVFEDQRPLGFWMKNTLIPLSIGFFDQDKRLIDIQEMEPAVAGEASPRVYNSAQPAMYALEMPKSWFARHKIEKGAKFSFAP
jgi:uncharacterized membrane protein (UPF0127 family)